MQLKWNAAAQAATKRRRLLPTPSALGQPDFDEGPVLIQVDEQSRQHQENSRSLVGGGDSIRDDGPAEGFSARSERLQKEGNVLAEEGKYGAALGKWEAALALTPGRAVLHEQKAQLHLERGATWQAVQAATRATELEPEWAEAWITLARAQLNYGEPGFAAESCRNALRLQPGNPEAQEELQRSLTLSARQRQLAHAESVAANRLFTGVIQPANGVPVSVRRAVVKDMLVPTAAELSATSTPSAAAPAAETSESLKPVPRPAAICAEVLEEAREPTEDLALKTVRYRESVTTCAPSLTPGEGSQQTSNGSKGNKVEDQGASAEPQLEADVNSALKVAFNFQGQ